MHRTVGSEIDSKAIINNWIDDLRVRAARLFITPRLHIIQVGADEASNKYVKNKIETAKKIGIEANHLQLPVDVKQMELDFIIKQFSIDPLILQLPVPGNLNVEAAIQRLDPMSDVDGFTTEQIGMLVKGHEYSLAPATALGIIKLLHGTVGDLTGKKVVIVNRSNLIGKPLFQLLLQENAQVTMLHSAIPMEQQKETMKSADIVITGCGKRKMYDHTFFKDGQVLIDCSMNRIDGVPGVGDMDKEDILEHLNVKIASGYGHTGPATVAALMENVIKTYELQMK